jgi:zinc-binding in reverse transcriptase
MTLNNKILTKDNLLKRGWQGDKHCIFCQQMEIVPHLFFHCPYIANLWHCIFASHPQSGLLKFTSLLNFWTSCTMLTVSDFQYWGTFLAATVWVIWLKRNHRIFHNSEGSRAKTKYYAICQLYKYWTGLSSNLKNILVANLVGTMQLQTSHQSSSISSQLVVPSSAPMAIAATNITGVGGDGIGMDEDLLD